MDETLIEIISETAVFRGVDVYRVTLRKDGSDCWHSDWTTDEADQQLLIDTLAEIMEPKATRTLVPNRHDA